MRREKSHFGLVSVPARRRLFGGSLEADENVAQVRHLGYADIVRLVRWVGEHVGGRVHAAVVAVERPNAGVVKEHHRDLALPRAPLRHEPFQSARQSVNRRVRLRFAEYLHHV